MNRPAGSQCEACGLRPEGGTHDCAANEDTRLCADCAGHGADDCAAMEGA